MFLESMAFTKIYNWLIFQVIWVVILEFIAFFQYLLSIFQLSKLQAANRAASVSYEQELEQTTTKVFIYFVLEM